MFRKPTFWVVLVLVAAASAWLGIANFSRAFPIVSLDITMDRASALTGARALQAKHCRPGRLPAGRVVRGDQEGAELRRARGGGTTAFHETFALGRDQLFQWDVRHFREGEARETKWYFTPRGEPYGFVVKLPEKEAGAALEAEQAQAIAERGAADWKVDLSKFTSSRSPRRAARRPRRSDLRRRAAGREGRRRPLPPAPRRRRRLADDAAARRQGARGVRAPVRGDRSANDGISIIWSSASSWCISLCGRGVGFSSRLASAGSSGGRGRRGVFVAFCSCGRHQPWPLTGSATTRPCRAGSSRSRSACSC